MDGGGEGRGGEVLIRRSTLGRREALAWGDEVVEKFLGEG